MALVVAGCSSDSKGSSATAAPAAPAATSAGGTTAAGGATLTITNSTFGAASVAAGTEFSIANNDSRAHTVTDDNGAFDVPVPAGGTATLTIAKPGSYTIHCKIHSSMHGTITVA